MSHTSNYPAKIFWLAFGYAAFYVPYSAMTKALSQGLLPGQTGPVTGFVVLPATAIATTVGLLFAVTIGRGWSSVRRLRLASFDLPAVRIQTLLSGLATAVIIATTTLNFTSGGISILLALLLMRGGVLILAPVVDAAFSRRVKSYSWVALGLSFAAIFVALSEVNGYRMTWAAGLIIGAYLTGYVVRINLMTWVAKSNNPAINRQFYFEEMAVAAIALTGVPAIVALFGRGEIAGQLREGFTVFLTTTLVWPALLIGLLYVCLYLFGTAIYLDNRENTFCIPLNRCASLISGIASSFALMFLVREKPPSIYQLTGAFIVLAAIGLLRIGSVCQEGRESISVHVGRRLFLFVCSGNTSRSPMAQAICNSEIARLLGLAHSNDGHMPFYAVSAGLTAELDRPMNNSASSALLGLSVQPHNHRSRPVTLELVEQADCIFCMTESQRKTLVTRFPHAMAKVERLDPLGDLDDPRGQDLAAFLALGERLVILVRQRLAALTSLRPELYNVSPGLVVQSST